MKRLRLSLAAATCLLPAAPALSMQPPISLRDSFPIGSGAGTLCTAQLAGSDAGAPGMFDRAYAVTCRDASVPVGQIYALRTRDGDPAARLAGIRDEKAACEAGAAQQVEGLGSAEVINCRLKDANVGYRVYLVRDGATLYAAQGLAGYDSALKLGLRTVIANRPVPGEVSIALTEAGDAAAFARVQAGTLDPQRALAEAYRRNNAGSYAESAEFFGQLLRGDGASQAEALANEGLQQSNLGNYTEANDRFERAATTVGNDIVLTRMLRNYRSMHLLNQRRTPQAVTELNRPMPRYQAPGSEALSQLVIDKMTAARLNADTGVGRQLGGTGSGLLPEEKAAILDAQAQYLRGTAQRLQGQPAQARASLTEALGALAAVRGGRVSSTIWMRAQLLGELASIAEQGRDLPEADRQHQAAIALLEANYPTSAVLRNTQARYASYLARTGQTEPALALFKQIVDANSADASASPALREGLAPYFALLAARGDQPAAVADMFKASQILVRPGVAQTQAILARELSGGSGDASRLFRQAVTLTRDIERNRVEVARLSAIAEPTASDAARLQTFQTQLQQAERSQVETQAKLAEYPSYRVVASGALSLEDLQKELREGEAYYKMVMAGDAGYAMFVTPASARAYKLGVTPRQLDRSVDALRDTITKVEDGQIQTFPFDAAGALRLYARLFGPVAGEVGAVRHLIVEPDGGMLRLPANLLVMDRAGVAAYQARAKASEDAAFDFTGVQWLGRDRDISTAVSARAFRDVRRASRSAASKDYIGFGQNAVPAGEAQAAAAVRGLSDASASCSWSIAEWTRPIDPAELFTASQIIGDPNESEIVTGEAFTDTAIKRREDLSQYRIMHFATHGLVTAPRPECPARPALMTSFGDEASDGLLNFAEIYDLKLDADLIILSACDTAGKATVAATREAGLTTGGDYALDGLVRAFVGAGGRSVIASHWPVPDDYDATKRLITGLFQSPAGTATATALRSSQIALMDAADTSHPYYWSGFAIIGDGSAPVIAAERQADASGGGEKAARR